MDLLTNDNNGDDTINTSEDLEKAIEYATFLRKKLEQQEIKIINYLHNHDPSTD